MGHNKQTVGVALFAAAIAAMLGCQSGGDDGIGEAVQPALILDSGLNFYSFKCNDAPAFDPADDHPNASEHRDLVGDPTEAGAALYFAADATRLYLRMRLDGDPRTNDPANLKSFGWAFLFDTQERGVSTVPEYERLAHVNGTGGVDRISLFDNVDFVENDPADKSENENVVYGGVVDRWVVERACDSATETCFSGDDDFFLTWALEWSDLEDDQAPWITDPVVRSAPTVLTSGTTVSNNAIDADYVCFDNAAGFPPLDGIPNDPVSLSCGNNLLDAGEGCDDGNQDDGDGCTAFCLVEDGFPCQDDADCLSNECDDNNNVCGSQCDNGELEGTEGCDDGNQSAGDGCGAACLIESGNACNGNPAGLLGDDSCESGICDETEAGDGLCEDAGTCGNSVVEAGEQCDDGNTASGDGCSAGCVIEIVCGTGVLQATEGCDDNNTDNGDGCNSDCLIENGSPCNADTAGLLGSASCASSICDITEGASGTCEPAGSCGNNKLETGEGCDDGNNDDLDGCSATCKIEDDNACNIDPEGVTGDASCASGICDTSEGGDGVCEPAGCGNNLRETSEGCDDGNTDDGDGCSASCLIEDGNACNADTPGATGDDSCASNICDTSEGGDGVCEPAGSCGNGVRETGEGCDDGGTAPGDGCSAACLIEDGNACNADTPGATGDDSCQSQVCDTSGGGAGVCESANTCGNNVLEAGEGCDDGNTAAGDGCDDSCLIEDDNACNDQAPGNTGNDSCASGICDTTEGGAGTCEPAGSCGNNVLEAGEGCDDGNTAAEDGCDDNCLIEDGGACNDDAAGNTGDTSCASGICDESEGGAGICEPSGCGNGILEAAEGCDDGNTTAGDGCAANCFLEDGQACNDDPAGQTGDGSCESGICDTSEGGAGVCEPAGCGNNRLEASEGCDDGGSDGGDGCAASCLLEDGESCNDDPSGQTGDESCESGICDTTEGGSGVCEPAGCGNNLVEGDEGCDDGNTESDDGCSATCFIEDGMPCVLDPDGGFDDSSCASDSCDSSGTCNPPIGVSGGGCSSAGGQASSAGLLALAVLMWLLVAPVRRRRAIAGALIAAAVALSGTPRASAQEAIDQGFALERFRLSSHDGGFLNVEWGSILGHLEWDGAFWLGASDDPLVVFLEEDGERERLGALVSHRVGATLMGSIGLYDRLQVTLELPMIMSQDEQVLAEVMPGLSGFGLGDLRVAPKVLIVSANGLHLAAVGSLTLPTGGGDDFRGDSNVTFAPEVVVSKQLGPWRMSANLGYRLRENRDLPRLGVGDELFAHLGASYRFAERGGPPLETGLTLATGTRAADPFGDFNSNQLELLGGASYRLDDRVTGVLAAGVGLEEGYGTPDWRTVLGLRFRKRPVKDSDGDGLVDNVDSCPNEPEDVDSFRDSDGCPDLDNDADRVADLEDGAPMDPEDPDGFEDTDGVPDPDNDGDGFADGKDQCPNEAETVNQIEDTDGCPDGDADGDKIADARDQCPQKPEDLDQFEDTDGCPDLDNDADGVVDASDRCVNEPGVVENAGCPDTDRDSDTVVDRLDNCPDEPGPPENQGCKKKQLVKIQQNKIELLEVVYFRTNRAKIRRRSHALLDNVAAVLAAHEHVTRVRVEGHTDARGDDAYNKDLSAKRARAVVDYLIARGIAAARLEPVGLGEEKPIADNKSRKGRAQNRRVEFVIVESAGVAPAPVPAPAPATPSKK